MRRGDRRHVRTAVPAAQQLSAGSLRSRSEGKDSGSGEKCATEDTVFAHSLKGTCVHHTGRAEQSCTRGPESWGPRPVQKPRCGELQDWKVLPRHPPPKPKQVQELPQTTTLVRKTILQEDPVGSHAPVRSILL